MPTNPEPYSIEEDAERKLAVVKFAVQCDHLRTRTHEDQLADLIERFDHVACDLSQTNTIASDWLRWIARLSDRARRAGKKLFLVGVKERVLRTADLLGLKNDLKLVATLDEGLGA